LDVTKEENGRERKSRTVEQKSNKSLVCGLFDWSLLKVSCHGLFDRSLLEVSFVGLMKEDNGRERKRRKIK